MLWNKMIQILVMMVLLAGFGGGADLVMAAAPSVQPVFGGLDAASPTWNRISDRTGNPDSANDNLPYDVIEITGGGDLTVKCEPQTQFDSFLALYSSFDPANPQANLLAADDDSAGYPHARLVKTGLTQGKYYLVISSYSGGADSVYPRYGNYLATVSSSYTVAPKATFTSLILAPVLAVAGQEVTMSATVTKTGGAAFTMGGGVRFMMDGTFPLGSTGVDPITGKALFKLSSIPPGGHSITAEFLGAPGYLPSTSPAQPLTVIQSPVLATAPPSGVTSASAVLNGMLNAMGHDATVSFVYGLDTGYGSTVSAVPASVSGNIDTPVSAALNGLIPETVYHYRLVVNASGLTFYSPDAVFTTAARLTVTRGGDGIGTVAGISGCTLSWNGNVGSCSPAIGDVVELRIIPSAGSYVVTPIGGSCGGSASGKPDDPVNGLAYSTAPQAADCSVAVTFSRMPAYNVTISNAASNQGFWDGSSWIPTGSGSNVNIVEIKAKLLAGEAVITTNPAAGEEGDIIVKDDLSWNSGLLKLSALRNIKINAVMTAEGTSSLNMETVSGSVINGLGGAGFYGRVDFPNRIETGLFSLISGYLTINNESYTVISTLGAQYSWTPVDLQGIAGNCNIPGRYALGADINAAETAGWDGGFFPLGLECIFAGVFDGLGHKVSDLSVSGYGYAGLFAKTASTSLIRNVGLSGGNIAGYSFVGGLVGSNLGTINNTYSSAAVTGTDYVGGLVGQNDGSISNSYSSGSVTGSGSYAGGLVGWNHAGPISRSFSSGAVTGYKYVGGLVGENYVAANNCLISDSFSSSSVHGYSEVGGMAGFNWGDYFNVYNSGAVSADMITNVGGLLGGSNAGAVTGGFWDMTVNPGLPDNGLGIGKTTTELQQLATFTADGVKWSIAGDDSAANAGTVWRILEGITYPVLRNFLSPQNITGFTPPAAATFGDGPITLSAAASSGLPVEFSVISGPGSITGNQLTITGPGTIMIKAFQPGNSGYSAATDVVASISVANIPLLTVEAGGTGGGTITSIPSGITCQKISGGSNVTCEKSFNGTVELHATASYPSIFNGWGGVASCSGSGSVCSFIMNADQTVTASFSAVPLIQIGTTSFTTLQDAYDAAADKADIQLLTSIVAGTLNAHRNITVKLKGGYDLAYSTNTGTTAVTAPMTIRQGTVVVDKVVIK